jgi:hypothetical protein
MRLVVARKLTPTARSPLMIGPAILVWAATLITLGGCLNSGHSQRRNGGIYTEEGDVKVQAAATSGCGISLVSHAVEVKAVRGGVVVGTASYAPGQEFVFNIGAEPFDLTASVDGQAAVVRVVPKSTGGVATQVTIVVPGRGCSPPPSSEIIYP